MIERQRRTAKTMKEKAVVEERKWLRNLFSLLPSFCALVLLCFYIKTLLSNYEYTQARISQLWSKYDQTSFPEPRTYLTKPFPYQSLNLVYPIYPSNPTHKTHIIHIESHMHINRYSISHNRKHYICQILIQLANVLVYHFMRIWMIVWSKKALDHQSTKKRQRGIKIGTDMAMKKGIQIGSMKTTQNI